jgi:hypothetical protein
VASSTESRWVGGMHWKPGGGPTQFRGGQRSGDGERVVAAFCFCFCGARGRVGAGAALKWLFVSVPTFRSSRGEAAGARKAIALVNKKKKSFFVAIALTQAERALGKWVFPGQKMC